MFCRREKSPSSSFPFHGRCRAQLLINCLFSLPLSFLRSSRTNRPVPFLAPKKQKSPPPLSRPRPPHSPLSVAKKSRKKRDNNRFKVRSTHPPVSLASSPQKGGRGGSPIKKNSKAVSPSHPVRSFVWVARNFDLVFTGGPTSQSSAGRRRGRGDYRRGGGRRGVIMRTTATIMSCALLSREEGHSPQKKNCCRNCNQFWKAKRMRCMGGTFSHGIGESLGN